MTATEAKAYLEQHLWDPIREESDLQVTTLGGPLGKAQGIDWMVRNREGVRRILHVHTAVPDVLSFGRFDPIHTSRSDLLLVTAEKAGALTVIFLALEAVRDLIDEHMGGGDIALVPLTGIPEEDVFLGPREIHIKGEDGC